MRTYIDPFGNVHEVERPEGWTKGKLKGRDRSAAGIARAQGRQIVASGVKVTATAPPCTRLLPPPVPVKQFSVIPKWRRKKQARRNWDSRGEARA